jgi:hypothetical protein
MAAFNVTQSPAIPVTSPITAAFAAWRAGWEQSEEGSDALSALEVCIQAAPAASFGDIAAKLALALDGKDVGGDVQARWMLGAFHDVLRLAGVSEPLAAAA